MKHNFDIEFLEKKLNKIETDKKNTAIKETSPDEGIKSEQENVDVTAAENKEE